MCNLWSWIVVPEAKCTHDQVSQTGRQAISVVKQNFNIYAVILICQVFCFILTTKIIINETLFVLLRPTTT